MTRMCLKVSKNRRQNKRNLFLLTIVIIFFFFNLFFILAQCWEMGAEGIIFLFGDTVAEEISVSRRCV